MRRAHIHGDLVGSPDGCARTTELPTRPYPEATERPPRATDGAPLASNQERDPDAQNVLVPLPRQKHGRERILPGARVRGADARARSGRIPDVPRARPLSHDRRAYHRRVSDKEGAAKLAAIANLPVGWVFEDPRRDHEDLVLRATGPDGDEIEVAGRTTAEAWTAMAESLAARGEGRLIR